MKVLTVVTSVAALAGSVFAAGGGSGLVVLHNSADGALTMTGSSKVLVPTNAVYVNSSSATSVQTTGAATLDTPMLYLVGGAAFNGQSSCTGKVIYSGTPYEDPMASLKFPTTEGAPSYGAKELSGTGTFILPPGHYSQGVSISGSKCTVLLQPGVHLISGPGFKMDGGTLVGEGVTLVILAGGMDVAGAAKFELSPPESGDTAGVVIAQPPSNPTAMSLKGGGSTVVTGNIYAPGAALKLTGSSTNANEGPQMGDLVVAGTVSLEGNAVIKIGKPEYTAIVLPKMPLYD